MEGKNEEGRGKREEGRGKNLFKGKKVKGKKVKKGWRLGREKRKVKNPMIY